MRGNDSNSITAADAVQAEARPPRGSYAILVGHFFAEFFHTDLVTSPEQLRVLIVGVLASIGLIGIVIPYMEIDKYARLHFQPVHPAMDIIRRAGQADKLFFLCCAMVVVSFATALQWELLFPDVRDYVNLMPLPVRMRDIFAAKLSALLLFCSLFVAVTAIPAAVCLPAIMAGRYLVPPLSPRWLLAQGTAATMAGFFCFFAIVAAEGLLMQLLSPRLFRKVSVWLQMFLLMAFLCSLAVIIEIPNLDRFMDKRPEWAWSVPPIWFLGLCERLLGNSEAFVAELARRAVMATAISGALMLALYAAGYWRHARRVLESLEPQRTGATGVALDWLLAHTIARDAHQIGVMSFMARTTARSRRHKLFLAAYLGVGFCLVLYGFADMFVGPWIRHRAVNWHGEAARFAILSIPLVMSFFALSGLRFLFSLPVDLKANWIFQVTEPEDRVSLLNISWKSLIVAGIGPVVALTMPIEVAALGWWQGAGSTIVAIMLSMIAIEWLMRDFAKIPFTCSYLPGRTNPALILPLYWGAFLIYATVMTAIEEGLLRQPRPTGFFIFVTVLAVVYRFSRSRRMETWGLDPVIYEDNVEPAVRTLGLSGN